MIIDALHNKQFYINKFPVLEKAFAFILKNGDIAHTKEKFHEIDDDMYASAGIFYQKKPQQQKLEVHRKYVDLQYVIKGSDAIGWKNLCLCNNIYKGYDKEKDIAFFNDAADFDIILNENNFALFFPDDAHSPLRGKEPVLKYIIKIKMERF